MKELLSSVINALDGIVSQAYTSLFNERNALIAVMFHGLVGSKSDLERSLVDPQLVITTRVFRQFIEYFLEHHYVFVSPEEIENGLESNKRYLFITFDDGYYNNYYAVPILKEYQVPATFFISTSHITENKCFWWDVVFRERIKRNATIEQIDHECETLKQKKNDAIEKYIMDVFGEEALRPRCDIDRPFTPSELSAFSQEPGVSLGNHTNNHAILTNCSDSEIKDELVHCQNAIHSYTGITPLIVAYPNGRYSDRVLTISNQVGFKLGVTVHGCKNHLPISSQGFDSLMLNRYMLLGYRNFRMQCASLRSDVQLKNILTSLIPRG